MCGHWWWLAAAFALVILCPAVAAPADPVRVGDLKGNVEVRLVAARTSRDRDQHLEAKFETRDKDRKEIVIGFAGFTTHEKTLESVIWGCVDHQRRGESGWKPVKAGIETVFSVPTGPFSGLVARCYLVSLKLGDGK